MGLNATKEWAGRETERTQTEAPAITPRTLRDDFAIEAMRAILMRTSKVELKEISEWSYALADAMILAREGKPVEPSEFVSKSWAKW